VLGSITSDVSPPPNVLSASVASNVFWSGAFAAIPAMPSCSPCAAVRLKKLITPSSTRLPPAPRIQQLPPDPGKVY